MDFFSTTRSPLRRFYLIFFVLLTISFTATNNFAANTRILIAADTEHNYHNLLIDKIQALSASQGLNFDIIESDDYDSNNIRNASVIITIGYEAAKHFIQNDTKKPVLSLLIPSSTFLQLLNDNVDSQKRNKFSAIYIDQPLNRHIQLIKAVSESSKRVGVLLGEHSRHLEKDLYTHIKHGNLTPQIVTVTNRSSLISETRQIAETTDILLAIPDNTIYNKRSIKGILLTTYRNRTPVIGYSQAYVRAGALAAVFSTPDDISNHTHDVLSRILDQNTHKAFREHPVYYTVAVNYKVAHSLNMSVPSESELSRKIGAHKD